MGEHERQLDALRRRCDALLNIVIPIGTTLFYEKDFNQLLERILIQACGLCNCDAGTLYLRTDDDHLRFGIVRNVSLKIFMGGTSPVAPPFRPLPLISETTGEANHAHVAAHVVHTGQTIAIDDAYHAAGFDFSGTQAFDRQTGYRSKSFLTIPLKNTRARVIGVLQLINALDDAGTVVPFDPALQDVIEAMALIVAAALEQHVREESLRQKIKELHIQIDQAKRAREVTAITDTEYFRALASKAQAMRQRFVTPSS